MALLTVLTPGNTAATSSAIEVPAGSSVTVGIYSAAPAQLASGVRFDVEQDTPGAPNHVTRLTNGARTTVLAGPGTFRISRPQYEGAPFGVFANQG